MADEKRVFRPLGTDELLTGWLIHSHKARDRHDEAASSGRWIDASEALLAKIELFDEHIDDPDGISLGNEVVQCLGQQGFLRAALSLDESLHGVTSG